MTDLYSGSMKEFDTQIYPYCSNCGKKDWRIFFALSADLKICACNRFILKDGPGYPSFNNPANFISALREKNAITSIDSIIDNAIAIYAEKPNCFDEGEIKFDIELLSDALKSDPDPLRYHKFEEYLSMARSLEDHGNWETSLGNIPVDHVLDSCRVEFNGIDIDTIDGEIINRLLVNNQPWPKKLLDLIIYCRKNDLLYFQISDLYES